MTAIKREQIIAKNAITDPVEETKQWNKALDITENKLKDIVKVGEEVLKAFNVGDSKDLKKLNDLLEENKDAVEKLDKFQKERIKTQKELDKIEKQRLKTIEKIKSSTTDEALELAKARIELQERNKATKELAKESLGLISAYQKESKRLNDLRKEYKDLAVQNKENTKEGKKLLKNITTLDKKLKDVDETVGQNQRSVGDYKKAVEGLNKTIGKLGIVAIVAKGFDLLRDAFGDTREGALGLQIAFSKFTESARVFINNVIDAWSGVKDLFVAIFDSFESLGLKAERVFLRIRLAALELLDKNPLADYTQEISDLNNELSGLNGQIEELEKSSASDAIDKIAKAFDGTVDTASRAIDAQEKFLRLQLQTRIEIERQEKALAGLAEKRQILQDISDDDTIGFITRAKAVERAQKAAEEFAQLELKLALTREKLAFTAIKQDLIRAGISVKSLEAQETQAEKSRELIRLLEQDNIARKVSDANDEAFTAAYIERRNKQVEAEAFRRDQEEKNRKTARDAFEQELDILEEFTEKRIANNEKIISSDSESLEDRRIALLENQALEKELLETSIDLILKQGKASIDLRKDLTDAEKEQQKALLTRGAIQEIINEQDAQEIFNLIRKLDLGEIEEKRLKETLKIKEDTAEINKESAKTETEAAQKTRELQEEIALQNKVLAGEDIKLDDERTKNQINNLQERLANAKEGSLEQLEIQKELNDLLIEDDKRTAKEREKLAKEEEQREIDARNKRIQDAQDLSNQVLDITAEELEKRDQARLDSFDDQISAQEKLISKLRENAVKGSEDALAFEEAQLEKQRLARQREEERQAKRNEAIALAQTFLNQVAEQSKEDPDTAIAEAFKNTFLARAIARGLLGFFEGTDDTGTGDGRLSDKYGNITGYTHENEMVFSAKQKGAMGHKTRDEIIDIVQDYDAGNTWAFMPKLQASEQVNNIDLSEVVASNERVVKAIQDNRVQTNTHWESLTEAVHQEIIGREKTNYKFFMKKINDVSKRIK